MIRSDHAGKVQNCGLFGFTFFMLRYVIVQLRRQASDFLRPITGPLPWYNTVQLASSTTLGACTLSACCFPRRFANRSKIELENWKLYPHEDHHRPTRSSYRQDPPTLVTASTCSTHESQKCTPPLVTASASSTHESQKCTHPKIKPQQGKGGRCDGSESPYTEEQRWSSSRPPLKRVYSIHT